MEIRGKLSFLLALIVVLSAVGSVYLLSRKPEGKTATVTDCDGVTYLAVLDQNKEVYAAITGVDNKLYAARINSAGEVEIDGSLFPIESYDGTLPSNITTAVSIHQVAGSDDFNYATAEVSKITSKSSNKKKKTDDNSKTTADNTGTDNQYFEPTTINTEDDTTVGASSTENTVLLADGYRKLFASGNYYISFQSNDPDISGDVVSAFQDGNIYLETTIEDVDCKVIVADGKGYVVIPDFKVYCIMPNDMVSEMTEGTITMDDGSQYETVEQYDVQLGDRNCQCEEYTYSSGNKKIYYFYNEQLVRFDSINSDGSTDIYDINEVSSSVDQNLFKAPKGYIKINLSWLKSQGLDID